MSLTSSPSNSSFVEKEPVFAVGTRVFVPGKGVGRVAFFGEPRFQPGNWVGIILDEPKGKNNGSVNGVKYFECKELHGVFVKPSGVQLEGSQSQLEHSFAAPSTPAPSAGAPQPLPHLRLIFRLILIS